MLLLATPLLHPPQNDRAESLFDNTEPLDGKDGKQGGLFSSPYLPSILEAIQPRWSLHQRKANGGQLLQLQSLERMQIAKPLHSSQQGLAIATHGQEVNLMAPSYEPAKEDMEESQTPSWVTPSVPMMHPEPSFMLTQPGWQFGFRLPAQTTAAVGDLEGDVMLFHTRNVSLHPFHFVIQLHCIVRSPSIASSQGSIPLSLRSSSVFSAPPSCGGSTRPTSCAPSECGPDANYGDNGLTVQQSLWLRAESPSQFRELAQVSERFPSAPIVRNDKGAANEDTSLPPFMQSAQLR